MSAAELLNVWFDYHGVRFFLAILRRNPIVFSISCPLCGVELEFGPDIHPIVNLRTRRLTVRPES